MNPIDVENLFALVGYLDPDFPTGNPFAVPVGVTSPQAEAWSRVLAMAEVTLTEAECAVSRHYRDTRRQITPSDIVYWALVQRRGVSGAAE